MATQTSNVAAAPRLERRRVDFMKVLLFQASSPMPDARRGKALSKPRRTLCAETAARLESFTPEICNSVPYWRRNRIQMSIALLRARIDYLGNVVHL